MIFALVFKNLSIEMCPTLRTGIGGTGLQEPILLQESLEGHSIRTQGRQFPQTEHLVEQAVPRAKNAGSTQTRFDGGCRSGARR